MTTATVQGQDRIERAKSGRASCTTCGKPIDFGETRVAQETNDISLNRLIHRFYHLDCAIAVHPDLVHRALANVQDGVELDRATVEARIAPRVALEREQRLARYEAKRAREPARAAAIALDDTSIELIAQLGDAPDDAATLAVLADQLQARGDPRGELIAIQLAHAAEPTPELADRRTRLFEELAPRLDPGDRLVWGTGFVRRLELRAKTGPRLVDMIGVWSHPSMRVMTELYLGMQGAQDVGFVSRLAELAPPSLRVVELDAPYGALPDLRATLAVWPRLDTLALVGRSPLDTLAHPTLRRLELGLGQPFAALALLDPARLPAVTELVLRAQFYTHDFDAACELLADRGWLARVSVLGLVGASSDGVARRGTLATSGTLTGAGIAALERGLAGRRLARLDLDGTPVRLAARARLAALCDTLSMPVIADADAGAEMWVEHSAKPEWGRGRVVERKDGKVKVDFGAAGVKVFKLDAPFLRYG